MENRMIDVSGLPDDRLLELDRRAQASYAKSLEAVEAFPHNVGLAACADGHRKIAYTIASEVARRLWAEADAFIGEESE